MKGVARRGAFVIDENGIIIYEEIIKSSGEIPDFRKIKESLK
jgi:peroxiredoxin